MLNIHFGRENIDMDALIINPMVYFKYNKKPMWFDDPFVKEIIKGVDGAEVIIGEALINMVMVFLLYVYQVVQKL